MVTDVQSVIQKLVSSGDISREEIILLLENRDADIQSALAEKASVAARENYGNKVLPLSGVYATKAIFSGRMYDAVTNVGNNPTVEGCRTTVETHILNFDADIYGMPLRVEFVSRIRGEVKFSGREALAAQISADVETAKNILRNIEK